MSFAIKLSRPSKSPSDVQQMTNNNAGSSAGDGPYESAQLSPSVQEHRALSWILCNQLGLKGFLQTERPQNSLLGRNLSSRCGSGGETPFLPSQDSLHPGTASAQPAAQF